MEILRPEAFSVGIARLPSVAGGAIVFTPAHGRSSVITCLLRSLFALSCVRRIPAKELPVEPSQRD